MSDLTPQDIMQLGLGFWGSKTLLSAIELGLFTELAKGELEAEVLTERLQLNSRGGRDFLDALVALGMLKRINGQYSNTPETDQFLDRNKPSYIRRDAGDDQRSALSLLGIPDRGLTDG